MVASYHGFLHGNGTTDTPRADRDVVGGQRATEVSELPVLREAQSVLTEHGFDGLIVAQCQSFHAEKMGRPSWAPGQYFRLLLPGYFEGLDSERSIAWSAADWLGVQAFLGLALRQAAPDQSKMSQTRRLIDLNSHRPVFT